MAFIQQILQVWQKFKFPGCPAAAGNGKVILKQVYIKMARAQNHCFLLNLKQESENSTTIFPFHFNKKFLFQRIYPPVIN